MSAEYYSKLFDSESLRHLEIVRNIRQEAWLDQGQSDLERMVLGITGSSEMLDGYEHLIEWIGKLLGQPVISIESVWEGDDCQVRKGRGGIISDEARVIASGFSDQPDTGYGRVGATLRIEAPVNPIVAFGSDGTNLNIFNGRYVNGDSILVAGIANHEPQNRTTDPNQDFRATYDASAVLLSRRTIEKHAEFFNGVNSVLNEIDRLAAS